MNILLVLTKIIIFLPSIANFIEQASSITISMIQTRIYVNYNHNFIHEHFVLKSVAYSIINGGISRKRSNLNLIDFRERLSDMRSYEQSIEVVVTICVDSSAPVKFLML